MKTGRMVIAVLVGILIFHLPAVSQQSPLVTLKAPKEMITLTDSTGNLKMRVNYSKGCVLDKIIVNGTEVTGSGSIVYSGIRVDSQFFSSRDLLTNPVVSVHGDSVIVSHIKFGNKAFSVTETWIFKAGADDITWGIFRKYSTRGTLEENDFPCWQFNSMETWDGALLDNGGVAWNLLLANQGDTYGSHTGTLTFWNKSSNNCLRITPSDHPKAYRVATFSHDKKNQLSVVQSSSARPVTTQFGLRRFLSTGKSVFARLAVEASDVSVQYRLQAFHYDSLYDRGTFKGVDGNAVNEMLNTIGRYGVVDRNLFGSNGWHSGYVVLQEPWLAMMGLAVDAPEFIRGYSGTLEYEKEHAIKPNGRVLPRWHQDASDAMSHSYQPDGFYECQWGYMLDAQPAYAIDVTEQFDMTGDLNWLRGFKPTCEKVLGYMIDRYLEDDGLFRVVQSSHRNHKGADWMDVVWASYKVASINAYMYKALVRWSELEKLLGDEQMSAKYQGLALRLKTAFNQDTAEGGFWNPDKKWYVYWREKDGSVYGNNLVSMVNFLAIGFGLCDDQGRKEAVLNTIENLMKKENLFIWPSCFFPYREGLGLQGVNYPFPNYENGDLFLAWAELGVRCYAERYPHISLHYIRNVIKQYKSDGLAHQRYTRVRQTGAGDDILSNNIMAVVGLYRDIYGIQPKYNRLYLNPHLTDELNGTRINYWLRNQHYRITLSTGQYTVHTGRFSVSSTHAFGLNVTGHDLRYFHGAKASCSLLISTDAACVVDIVNWTDDRMKWKETTQHETAPVSHQVSHLRPLGHYELFIGGKSTLELTADAEGVVHFKETPGTHGQDIQIVYKS